MKVEGCGERVEGWRAAPSRRRRQPRKSCCAGTRVPVGGPAATFSRAGLSGRCIGRPAARFNRLAGGWKRKLISGDRRLARGRSWQTVVVAEAEADADADAACCCLRGTFASLRLKLRAHWLCERRKRGERRRLPRPTDHEREGRPLGSERAQEERPLAALAGWMQPLGYPCHFRRPPLCTSCACRPRAHLPRAQPGSESELPLPAS